MFRSRESTQRRGPRPEPARAGAGGLDGRRVARLAGGRLGRRGAILFAVMVILFLTTVVVHRLVSLAYDQVRYENQRFQREELRPTAFSLLEVALAVVHEFREIDEGLFSPVQGWGEPMEYAGFGLEQGMQARVRVSDESGKLPLNALSKQELSWFLEELGLTFREAEELADAFLDWTDPNELARLNGAEASWYEREGRRDGGLPRLPPNEPLRSFDDFRYIRGFRELFFDERGRANAFFEDFRQSVTLYATGGLNINNANERVLATLNRAGGSDELLFLEHREGNDSRLGTADDGYFRGPGDIAAAGLVVPEGMDAGVEALLLRVEVVVSTPVRRFQLVALVRPGSGTGGDGDGGNTGAGNGQQSGSGSYPFQILSLVENLRLD